MSEEKEKQHHITRQKTDKGVGQSLRGGDVNEIPVHTLHFTTCTIHGRRNTGRYAVALITGVGDHRH
jgi:hypothetical protein